MQREKVRIYSLARELNIDSKELVDLCKQAGIDVKNQLSSLDPEQRDAVELLVRRGGAAVAVAPPPKAGPAIPTLLAPVPNLASRPARREPEVVKAATASPPKPAAGAPPVEESAPPPVTARAPEAPGTPAEAVPAQPEAPQARPQEPTGRPAGLGEQGWSRHGKGTGPFAATRRGAASATKTRNPATGDRSNCLAASFEAPARHRGQAERTGPEADRQAAGSSARRARQPSKPS